MRLGLRHILLLLLLAPAAYAQNPPAVRPAGGGDLDPANDPAIRKELEKVHDEISNLIKQQTDLLKTITPNAGIIPPLGGNRGVGLQPAGPTMRLYGAGRTGLALIGLPADVRTALKIDPDLGVLVNEVFPDTPAAIAGYKSGDVLVEFNGTKVPSDLAAFMAAAAFIKNDVPVRGAVLRGDKKIEMGEMKLTDRRVIPAPVMKGDLVPCAICPRGPAEISGVQMISNGKGPAFIANPLTIQRFDGVKDVTYKR